MLVEAIQVLQKAFIEWEEDFFSEEVPRENPFVFDHQAVLDAANDYLKTYIEEEIEKVMNDRQLLVFTNIPSMPFAREDEARELHLAEMFFYIERVVGEALTEYEKAYFTYVFYNDIEESIMSSVFYRTLFASKNYREWNTYLFLQKIGALLQEGQEILFTDLQELYAAYNCKRIWQYHMEV